MSVLPIVLEIKDDVASLKKDSTKIKKRLAKLTHKSPLQFDREVRAHLEFNQHSITLLSTQYGLTIEDQDCVQPVELSPSCYEVKIFGHRLTMIITRHPLKPMVSVEVVNKSKSKLKLHASAVNIDGVLMKQTTKTLIHNKLTQLTQFNLASVGDVFELVLM